MENLKTLLPNLSTELIDELLSVSSVASFSKGTQILRDEQYVKVIPIVLNGLVKVFSSFNNKDLLLYYIAPAQSCVMSFYAALSNKPSRVYATTEEDSEILLVPIDKLPKWLLDYPDFSQLFFAQYDLRYSELLDTIEHLLVDKMDKRLYDYLIQKSTLTNNKPIKISHGQIATELGTAREVITRMLKKLESNGKIVQTKEGILIIGD